MDARVGSLVGRILTAGCAALAFAGCGSTSSTVGTLDGGHFDASQGDVAEEASIDDSGIVIDDATSCPSTCASLGANCGTVTDTKCGGVITCGDCASGEVCGGGGTPNVCGAGSNPDACVPVDCASQHITCGSAGDGCGGTLACGSCSLPQTCGGDPAKPGQCGCTGMCAKVPTCAAGTTTTFTGKVFDPAGAHPLPGALVYVPNDPSDPGLAPFAAGIHCDVCGATAAGNPLVSTTTAADGSFTLSGVPVGTGIPVVIQLGRWRRQLKFDIANSCAANAAPANLTMPKTHLEGDLPRIAVLTGGLDPVECTLRKMGVADSEFTNPGGGGYINFYKALDSDPHNTGVQGHGAVINASTPGQTALFATTGGVPAINQYDMVILECEGYPQTEPAGDLAALRAYAEGGGRLFASDFAWSWLRTNGNFATAANWSGALGSGTANPATIDLVSNPKGALFAQWLEIVGVSTPGSHTVPSIYPAFHNTTGIVAPTQQWLTWNAPPAGTPLHFTFNTPVGAASSAQCGRVVFSDWHAQQPTATAWPNVSTFPAECPAGAWTAQQTILEFMLFDLASCVQPYTPICTPRTCAAAGVDCGPASDGCGGALSCGTCPSGQYCGGGGPGKCGNTASCTPQTCVSQSIECGPAGDGCGNKIDCGNCPTGSICGAGGPGKCGKVS